MASLPNIPWIGPMRARTLEAGAVDRVTELLVPEHGLRSRAKLGQRGRAVLGLALLGVGGLLLHDFVPRGFLRTPAIPAAAEAGDSEMSRSRSLMAGVLGVGVVACGSVAQQAVQWSVEDGGNGHWYQGVKLSTSTHVGWEASRAFAIARGADLACLNTTAELDWVYAQIASSPALWSWSCGPWIGAYQAQGAREPGSQWFWIDGSTLQSDFPWTFSQPDDADDCGGNEAYAFYWYGEGPPSPANRFADLVQSGHCLTRAAGDWVTSAVLEWSSDCNNDGIVDYGQVLSGELADLEGDNVPDCCQLGVACDCSADIDGNGFVNGVELTIVLTKWGTSGGKDYPAADIDRSGIVDGADLARVLSNWGPCP